MGPHFVDEKSWREEFHPVYERVFRVWKHPEIEYAYPQDVFANQDWRMVLLPKHVFLIESFEDEDGWSADDDGWPEDADPRDAWPPFFAAVQALGDQELIAAADTGVWVRGRHQDPILFEATVEGFEGWAALDNHLYMLDCAVFGRSDRWGMQAFYFNDGLSVVSGDEEFMTDFIDRSGGLAAMQRRFIVHAENTVPDHPGNPGDADIVNRHCDEVGWPRPDFKNRPNMIDRH